jgi:hypothetical protein
VTANDSAKSQIAALNYTEPLVGGYGVLGAAWRKPTNRRQDFRKCELIKLNWQNKNIFHSLSKSFSIKE